MLQIAMRRGGEDDPDNGRFTGTFIMEKLLEKRRLLPPDQESHAVGIIACTELYRSYLMRGEIDKALEISKAHLAELMTTPVSNAAENKSLVFFQIAVCNNFKGDSKQAEYYLKGAFNALKLDTLPPHRFKKHLMSLITLCHHHQLIENKSPNAFPFLNFAYNFYKNLDKALPNLQISLPWNSIIEQIELETKEHISDAQVAVEAQGGMKENVASDQNRKAMAINDWIEMVGTNPNYSIKYKAAALRAIVLQFDLSDKEIRQLNAFVRKIQAAEALVQNFDAEPTERSQTRTVY